jgi:hypothetical protein
MITIGTIIGTKDGIHTLGVFESLCDMGCGDRPGITRLVAAGATPAILPRAQNLKKRPREIDFPGRAERFNFSRGVLKGEEIWEKTAIGQSHRHGTEQQPTLQPDAQVQHDPSLL